MKKTIILALSGVLFANGFSQETVQRKLLTNAEKAQITEELKLTLNRWEKAFNAKDTVALANLYDPNTDVIYDDDVHHRSRESMLKHFHLAYLFS